jgi:beta-galactosidase
MELLDQSYGYVLYRKQFPQGLEGKLTLDHLYDFAVVYVNGRQVGTLDRHYHQDSLELNSKGPARLDILVENTGRLNSTKWMRDERKGFRAATLNGSALLAWKIFSVPMDTLPRSTAATTASGPHFSTGTFELRHTGDTYLDVRALGKGLLWINGHPLGRFWNIGPQGTLYLPGPWLRKGTNRITAFELLNGPAKPQLRGLAQPILDEPTPTYESDPERHRSKSKDGEFGAKLAAPADAPSKP